MLITHCEESDEDRALAIKIQEYLEVNEIPVIPDEAHAVSRETIVENSMWHIFILSHEALQSNSFCHACSSTLTHCLNTNCVKMLPVLRDVKVDRVPAFMKWVTLLMADDPRFHNSLLATIKGNMLFMPADHLKSKYLRSAHLSVCLSVHPSVLLSIHLSVYPRTDLAYNLRSLQHAVL